MINLLFFIIFSVLSASPVEINISTDREDYRLGEYIKLTLDKNH